jgi:hypothetical protein
MLVAVLKQRALVYAVIGTHIQNMRKPALDMLYSSEEYVLPHLFKPDSIRNGNKPTKEQIANWKDLIAKAKAAK